jgi:hypothetical protein
MSYPDRQQLARSSWVETARGVLNSKEGLEAARSCENVDEVTKLAPQVASSERG